MISFTLSQRIAEARMAKNMSQLELARATGLSEKTIFKIESGDTSNPTITTVKKIAQVLGVSVDSLIDSVVSE